MALPLGYVQSNTLYFMHLNPDQEKINPAALGSQGNNSEFDETVNKDDPSEKIKRTSQEAFSPTHEPNKIEDPQEEKNARRRETDWVNRVKKRKDCGELNEENERLTADNKTLKMQNTELWSQYFRYSESKSLLIRQIEVIENQKSYLSSEVDSLIKEIEGLKNENLNLRKELGQ